MLECTVKWNVTVIGRPVLLLMPWRGITGTNNSHKGGAVEVLRDLVLHGLGGVTLAAPTLRRFMT